MTDSMFLSSASAHCYHMYC